jgi:hypothetical protein
VIRLLSGPAKLRFMIVRRPAGARQHKRSVVRPLCAVGRKPDFAKPTSRPIPWCDTTQGSFSD